LKYLIAGLGNIGDEYSHTRHNIGFDILDALVKASNIHFEDKRFAYRSELKFKGRILILIKPTTFVNLSGRALNYWMQKEKLVQENLLVVVDDISLPFGTLRLRPKGSDGGHNGLRNINEIFGHQNYARLRFGIGNQFFKGQQVDFVLSNWNEEEEKELPQKVEKACDVIKSFVTIGLEKTMTNYNKK